jgi:formylglycine-generating enzyme required for sulfatase activity
MNGITWYEAAEYCNWLSAQDGMRKEDFCFEPNDQGEYAEGMKLTQGYETRRGYRLPTEVEWEYACRAGAGTSRYYGTSEALLGAYAWYSKNSRDRCLLESGRLKPNDLGLFDMLGNVMEWCAEPFVAPPEYSLRRLDAASDESPIAEPVVDVKKRVLRGGAFLLTAPVARCAHRFHNEPNYRSDIFGFRVVRNHP